MQNYEILACCKSNDRIAASWKHASSDLLRKQPKRLKSGQLNG